MLALGNYVIFQTKGSWLIDLDRASLSFLCIELPLAKSFRLLEKPEDTT